MQRILTCFQYWYYNTSYCVVILFSVHWTLAPPQEVFFVCLFFILLYNTVLVLPYINMHPPRVYTCSQSWTSSHLSPYTRRIEQSFGFCGIGSFVFFLIFAKRYFPSLIYFLLKYILQYHFNSLPFWGFSFTVRP